jgi:hypothetical protein
VEHSRSFTLNFLIPSSSTILLLKYLLPPIAIVTYSLVENTNLKEAFGEQDTLATMNHGQLPESPCVGERVLQGEVGLVDGGECTAAQALVIYRAEWTE